MMYSTDQVVELYKKFNESKRIISDKRSIMFEDLDNIQFEQWILDKENTDKEFGSIQDVNELIKVNSK